MSQTTVVIPLRGLHGGKSRLSSVLDPVQRSNVIAALAEHVLGAVLESNVADSIAVVSREHDLLHALQLHHPNVRPVVQTGESIGMNAAVDSGRQVALHMNTEQLLVISADLPLITAADLAAMQAIEHDVTIAPDRFGTGTNAIMIRGRHQISRFLFQFGRESRGLHEAEASRLGLSCSSFEARRIALDLDAPDDWDMLTPGMQRRLLSPRVFGRLPSESVAAADAVAILEPA